MEISNHIQTNPKKSEARLESKKKPPPTSAAKTLFHDKDSVELSQEIIKKRLDLVKNRIKTGFYSSSLVKNDLSEKLTKAWQQVIS